jgi:hypothetical protein
VPTCFIVMPVSTSSEDARVYGDDIHFNHVLLHLMIPAVERAGYQAIEPLASGADIIQAEIIRQLETADLVLCDISTLNANVFFELGIRTAVDKPVCIVKDTVTEKIPFDTSIINVLTYEPSMVPWLLEEQIKAIAKHLRASAERSDRRNTLWRYFGLTTRAAFREGESSLEEKVDLLLLQFRGLEAQSMQGRATSTEMAFIRSSIPTGKSNFEATPEVSLPVEAQIEFIDRANKIGRRARVSELNFRSSAIIAAYVGDRFSEEERAELENLASQYGLRLYLYSKGQMPGG